MTGLLAWALILGGPVVCAIAGGTYEHLRLGRAIEAWLDDAYGQGWDAARARYQDWFGSMQLDAEHAQEATATMLPAAPVAAAERLAALPPLDHEGPRHARPQEAAQVDYHDPLITGVRAEFDRIRFLLGYDAASFSQLPETRPARRLAIADHPEVGP